MKDYPYAKELKRESVRKIFAKVFDRQTIETIHGLAVKRFFEEVEFVVSTGKEAHVFRARDVSGNFRAVKVYKISTSDFKHMNEYIEGDMRFKDIKKDKRGIVFAWAKKEFKNLERAAGAGVRVPMPLAFKNNVLVMEFIGEKGEPSKPLRVAGFGDAEKLRKTLVEWLAKMYKAGIVHADLSDYNILVKGGELVLIDIGQAVLSSHPKAREFFERDLRNAVKMLERHGISLTEEDLLREVREGVKTC